MAPVHIATAIAALIAALICAAVAGSRNGRVALQNKAQLLESGVVLRAAGAEGIQHALERLHALRRRCDVYTRRAARVL
jgi:hypothetical protein